MSSFPHRPSSSIFIKAVAEEAEAQRATSSRNAGEAACPSLLKRTFPNDIGARLPVFVAVD